MKDYLRLLGTFLILFGCFIAHPAIGCIATGAFLIVSNASEDDEPKEEIKNP